MVAHTEQNDAIAYRLALEALRNGVPNREAVRILGCNQPHAEARFADMLSRAEDADNPTSGSQGMLVSGDFGSGKSHLLAYLEHQALSRNFVCSKVAISKETPLYDLGKVFTSAVENGRIPGRNGRLIEELGQTMNPNSQEYDAFFRWASDAASGGLLSPMFPASLVVHQWSADLELNSEIESFWAGDRIRIATVRSGLRQIGQLANYTFRAPRAADLPPQRLRFATELIKAAGYRGWVILLDEIELIGSYSILQRGRSYAELARWMGQAGSETYPGLVVVGTVTDDFAAVIINPTGDKKDHDYVGARLDANDRYKGITIRAEAGMNLLETGTVPLDPPTDDDVSATLEELRKLYSAAYGWDAPPQSGSADGTSEQRRMRYKVRAAINVWDLMRLRPGSRPETEIDDFSFTYEEDTALERESKDSDG